MSRADRSSEQVEFTVKPEEDLILEGTERTITRVHAGTPYSCLMLKTQRFSSLFRHYAKYHGLRKDDLEYYFVNPLENEDTPESVQLQRGDTIMVRKRRKPEVPEADLSAETFFTVFLFTDFRGFSSPPEPAPSRRFFFFSSSRALLPAASSSAIVCSPSMDFADFRCRRLLSPPLARYMLSKTPGAPSVWSLSGSDAAGDVVGDDGTSNS